MGTYCLLLLAAVVAAVICDDRVEILKGRTDNNVNNRRTRPLEAGTDFDAHSPYDVGGHHMHGMHHGGHHMHGGYHGQHAGEPVSQHGLHHGSHHGSSHGSHRRRGGQTGVSSLASFGGRLTPENRPFDADGAKRPPFPDSSNPDGGMDRGRTRLRDPHHRRMTNNMASLDSRGHRMSMLGGQGRGQDQGQGTDDASSLDMRSAWMIRGNRRNLEDGDFRDRRGHHTGSRRGHRGHGHHRGGHRSLDHGGHHGMDHGGHPGMHHGGPRIQYGDDSATRYHRRHGPRYQI